MSHSQVPIRDPSHGYSLTREVPLHCVEDKAKDRREVISSLGHSLPPQTLQVLGNAALPHWPFRNATLTCPFQQSLVCLLSPSCVTLRPSPHHSELWVVLLQPSPKCGTENMSISLGSPDSLNGAHWRHKTSGSFASPKTAVPCLPSSTSITYCDQVCTGSSVLFLQEF